MMSAAAVFRLLAQVGTRDATNSFKAYSTAFVRAVGIDSRDGFEIGIELTAKARRLRLPIAEIPTIWLDRQQGLSNFQTAAWLPSTCAGTVSRSARGSAWTSSGTGPRPVPRRLPAKGTVTWTRCWSAAPGFISGYLVAELLARGYQVTGVDNFSKYGQVSKSYDDHPHYRLVEGDARDGGLMTRLLAGCDHFVAGAAMIGGISYFHTYAYDLLAANERIIAASCDAAIEAHRAGRLRKVTYVSSSMVFEAADSWPSSEGQELQVPPPRSSTVSRSWPWSTSPAPPMSSTGCRTRSCGRSTASASGRAGAAGTSRSCPGTCGWP